MEIATGVCYQDLIRLDQMKLKGLYQKTDSKIWYYQPPMAKGVRPKPISLATKDEETAVAKYYAVAAELEEQFRRGSIRMELVRYVQEKKLSGEHSPATTDHTERTMDQVIKMLGNREVSSYTSADMKSLRETWMKKNLSPASVHSYFGRVGAFFAWAVKEGLTKKNPLDEVTMNRRLPTRAERYCSKEERDRLIDSLPMERLDLALCLWLGFFAGFRKMDIVEARRDWIDLEGAVITVRPTDTYAPKGKKARRIRMSPRLKEFLTLYMESIDFGDSVYLLRPDRKPGKKQKTRGKKAWRYRWDPRAPFAAHVKKAKLEWVGFHTMRHTFATLHALAGTPLTTIAKELGDNYKVVYENYVGYTRHDNHSAAAD
jgi:integrase